MDKSDFAGAMELSTSTKGLRGSFIHQSIGCRLYNSSWTSSSSSWDRLGPGTWGPLPQCLHLDKCLLEQHNPKTETKHWKGLKIAACMRGWGTLWTTRHKRAKNPNCHFWGAKSKSRMLHMHPAHGPTQGGWADHLSHPSGGTPGPYPT